MVRIATLVVIATVFAAPAAWSAPTQPERRKPPEAGITFRSNQPNAPMQTAPALHTDVDIDVTGIIAKTRIRQTFKNPEDAWVEGVYVFPLPEKAAVDELRMRIGERIIEGEIRERKKAKAAYDEARRAGKQTSLIEQERANIFTASIANIPPKGNITVEIGYQQRLHFADGTVSLRFPAVVGPRFIPGNRAIAGIGGTGSAVNSDLVPDAERITPPVRHPSLGPASPLAITVRLNPGMPIAMLRSPSHAIAAAAREDNRYDITLKGGDTPANRDFVLDWRPDTGDAPFAALFSEVKNGETYLMAIVAPPAGNIQDQPRIPREIIFIIDTSGSMHGASIVQARAALKFALDRMHPDDRFNIVRFSSAADTLFTNAKPASSSHIHRAKRFVQNLNANGGTNIASALDLALDGRIGGERLRQVVLITDGSVGNEAALFRRIRRDIGDSRLFTIGIGSAPNSHFMRRSAAFGRGTFTHIGSTRDVSQTMTALFEKLERPAMTQIAATSDGTPLSDQWPAMLPDLYHGEPLVLTARLSKPVDNIALTGSRGGQVWSRSIYASSAHQGKGIAKMWARDGIASAMDELVLGANLDAVREAVLELALTYGLLSKYTSLISIDKTPVRLDSAALERRAVPVELPAGWNYAAVFGGRTATPAGIHILTGIAALLLGGLLLLARRRRMT
ncbi:MAG: marine proteobacterial sortase target protein [Alphaproteobacteria bacterium]|nr:marine proteobacterial sortase target protein [Alphaproteobacteria bacterium]